MKKHVLLTLFCLFGCNHIEEAEPRIHIGDLEPLTPIRKRVSLKRCYELQEQALLKKCITQKEFEILRQMQAIPFCDDENQFFTWIGCSKE